MNAPTVTYDIIRDHLTDGVAVCPTNLREAMSHRARSSSLQTRLMTKRPLLHELTRDLGRPPTQTDMETWGPYSIDVYHNRFGSWTAAFEEAGLQLD